MPEVFVAFVRTYPTSFGAILYPLTKAHARLSEAGRLYALAN
jgi:hypothetical protein